MRSKIWYILGGIAAIGLAVLVWQLDIPHWQTLDLDRIHAQPKASVVYDANGEAVGTLASAENRVWISIDDVPDTVKNAFIAAEDQRFYAHNGINVRRIFGALLANIKSGGYAQGASTITQQLVKLTHLSESKTLSRKAQEAVLALQLERRLSKDEILESYLNTIYFGHGAYGIATAAETYFQKDVSELTLAESALLAGVIKAPSSYAPHINPERSVRRRNLILGEMAESGFITAEEAERAKNESLRLAASGSDGAVYGWFMDATLDEAARLLSMEVDDVLCAGYAIRTAFDPVLQDAADAQFADATRFPVGASDGTPVQAALVAMRPDTGEICALVGGRSYEVQRGLNRATQIQRSPGSAIKPVSSYAAAIDAYDFTPTSMVEDTPRAFDGGYSPGNAGGNTYGTVTLREALSRSLNVATVDLADLIGVNAVRNYALRFGLTLSWQDENLALALGSMTYGVSPAELCAAYGALANGGMRVSPHLIRSIADGDGRVLYEAEAPSERAVKDSTAYMLTDMLVTAAQSGSARALASVPIPVAGKTGTVADADGATRDIWTAAYTPDLAVAVWMGYDAPDDQHRLSSSEGGSGYPARLCAAFLSDVAPSLSGSAFVRPSSVRTALVDALALANDEVLLATEHTPAEYVVAELFHPGALPDAFSTEWSAPETVDDLTLISGRGETPVLQFTSRGENVEYLILRTCEGETRSLATLTGAEGETLRYADTDADLAQRADYAILPRHKLLYEHGELLTGPESAAVHYAPGGLLSWLAASDPGNDAADIEMDAPNSLFG